MMRMMLGRSLAMVVVSSTCKRTITNVVMNFFNLNYPFLIPESIERVIIARSLIIAIDNLRRLNFQALIAANREVVFPSSQRPVGAIQSSFAFQRDR